METVLTNELDRRAPTVVFSSSTAWRVAAAQKCGSRHEAAGANCEDSYRTATISPDVLLIAVADGAGSASHAELGANMLCEKSLEYLNSRLAQPDGLPTATTVERILRETMTAAWDAVQATAKAGELDVRDLSSTLILVVARRDFIAAAQVGDGAVVVADAEGAIFGLTKPMIGEYINETVFLTSAESVRQAQIKIWEGRGGRLAVFTDGLQMLCLEWPQYLPHEGFFAPLFNFMATAEEDAIAGELTEFLTSARLNELTDDDVTLVLASVRDADNES